VTVKQRTDITNCSVDAWLTYHKEQKVQHASSLRRSHLQKSIVHVPRIQFSNCFQQWL